MPVSLIMVTMRLVPGNSDASLLAAATLQPEEMPQKIPSSRASRCAVSMDSCEETVTTPSGGPAATGTGGLLARPSNSGTFERNEFIYVPEASVNLSRRLNEHLDVSLGYTFIYWSSILLAADQVDMSVNPNGGTSPAFTFNDTDFWVQGVNVGLEFHY